MNKNSNLLKSSKYIILCLFIVLAIVSALLMGKVNINYNISKYLDEDTDTRISLDIMEKEFGLISNVQVMINDITSDEADAVKTRLEDLENVILVNFDSQNPDYYKDNTALFVCLVNGNEYSSTANETLEKITLELDDYSDRIEFGGTIVEKNLLKSAIRGEILLILVISLCLVAVIMILTSYSWIEPFILLAASGFAVLINMGSNIIFGEISYITSAIAAILQLALSVDYSIVLLHSFRDIKKQNPEYENEHAMLIAIKSVFKPVSASALTTIAGLFALLFMSFTIGFDIGIVLIKSIVISAITSLTLLPALLLIFYKLIEKTAKKPITLKSKFFSNIALKAGKIVVPVGFILIILCCIVNTTNSFKFVDSCNKNTAITDKFGESGSLVVLYENTENSKEKEEMLNTLLSNYKKNEGKNPVKGVVSSSTTIGQIFDVDKAVKDFGISRNDAELLFTIYYWTGHETDTKMNNREFVEFAIDLVNNDEDAKGYISEETIGALQLILTIEEMMDKEYTAEEFHKEISSLEILNGVSFDRFAIDQMYGLYFYSEIKNPSVRFENMIEFASTCEMLDEESKSALKSALEAYKQFKDFSNNPNLPIPIINPKTTVNRKTFVDFLFDNFGELLEGVDLSALNGNEATVWSALGFDIEEDVPFVEFLTKMLEYPIVKDEVTNALNHQDFNGVKIKYEDLLYAVNNYEKIYNTIFDAKYILQDRFNRNCTYKDFVSTIKTLANDVNGFVNTFYSIIDNVPSIRNGSISKSELGIPNKNSLKIPSGSELSKMIPDTAAQQLYIMYFYKENKIPRDKTIGAETFLKFIIDESEKNETVNAYLPSDLNIAGLLSDVESLEDFLGSDEMCDYIKMRDNITAFASSISSIKVDASVTDTAMMGLYLKYAMKHGLVDISTPIAAPDLLAFLIDASENNELLKDRLSDEMVNALKENEEKLASGEKLLVSENYSRMLLTVNLPAEGEETTEFINFLITSVKDVFGEKAYVAGEIATTNDLQQAFKKDNTTINVFTVVSIFVIILIVFRSISLPVILVAVIQGAIWITMSLSVLGEPMFFMSYIMSTAILMGATIDYGILLSTNYVKFRSNLDKKEALSAALDATLPTVFTSGLILTICGFVVGLVATQTSISSVGFLLCRGTITSCVMITLVLPAILYFLDKVVIKLTFRKDSTKANQETSSEN